ncbi:MAG: hypothetical protein IT158_08910 [Bryobacterales bacterium]|nr:hypothetical protein [Bryobacterales bacterium]
MFFRRENPRSITLQDRLQALRAAGFAVQPESGGNRDAIGVVRDGCACVIAPSEEGVRFEVRPGLLVRGEIAALVDGGFQKFFRTPGGARKPALASELKALHRFQEDLREGLGLKSLYNESLGTVSNVYQYDRVQDRDRGVPRRPWEL